MNNLIQQITDSLVSSGTGENFTSHRFGNRDVKMGGGIAVLWFIIFFVVYFLILFLIAFIAKLIWNAIMPEIFPGVKEINSILDMLGLMILGRIIL